MEWIPKRFHYEAHPFKDDFDHDYRVFVRDGFWVANYTPNLNRYAGYLSNRLRIEIYYGDPLKTNCRFPTKKQAMEVCERHYKLLILQ